MNYLEDFAKATLAKQALKHVACVEYAAALEAAGLLVLYPPKLPAPSPG